jgi:hypothetical protein
MSTDFSVPSNIQPVLPGQSKAGVVRQDLPSQSSIEELAMRIAKILDSQYLIVQIGQPSHIEFYKNITNILIKHINKDAYKKKERIVKALTRLVPQRID